MCSTLNEPEMSQEVTYEEIGPIHHPTKRPSRPVGCKAGSALWWMCVVHVCHLRVPGDGFPSVSRGRPTISLVLPAESIAIRKPDPQPMGPQNDVHREGPMQSQAKRIGSSIGPKNSAVALLQVSILSGLDEGPWIAETGSSVHVALGETTMQLDDERCYPKKKWGKMTTG